MTEAPSPVPTKLWSIWELTPPLVLIGGVVFGILAVLDIGNSELIVTVVLPLFVALLGPAFVLTVRVLNNRWFKESKQFEWLWIPGVILALTVAWTNWFWLSEGGDAVAGLTTGLAILLAFMATVVLGRAADRIPVKPVDEAEPPIAT